MKSYIFLLVFNIFLFSCTTNTVSLRFKEPPKINLDDIKNVGVLSFRVIDINSKNFIERNGDWQISDSSINNIEDITNSVRLIVLDKLSSSNLNIEFSDKLNSIRSDTNLSQLISSGGESVDKVDAFIDGLLWVDVNKFDGSDVAKQTLTFSIASEEGAPAYSIDTVSFWNYQKLSGSLSLELRLIDSKTGRILASTYQSRRYKHKIGGQPANIVEEIKKYIEQGENYIVKDEASDQFKNQNPEVFPTMSESINMLAESVASDFISKTIPTYKSKNVVIASGGNEKLVELLKLGAYEFALDELSKINNPKPADIYNQALAFEGLGEYQTALSGYREAIKLEPGNLIYAQGIGRLERLKRAYNNLDKNLN